MTQPWLHITVEVPASEGEAFLNALRETAQFRDTDWCEMQRPDFARVSWGPIPARTESGYEPSPAVAMEDPILD